VVLNLLEMLVYQIYLSNKQFLCNHLTQYEVAIIEVTKNYAKGESETSMENFEALFFISLSTARY